MLGCEVTWGELLWLVATVACPVMSFDVVVTSFVYFPGHSDVLTWGSERVSDFPFEQVWGTERVSDSCFFQDIPTFRQNLESNLI